MSMIKSTIAPTSVCELETSQAMWHIPEEILAVKKDNRAENRLGTFESLTKPGR